MSYKSNLIDKLNKREYWAPTKKEYYKKIEEINSSNNNAPIKILDHLSDVMRSSEVGVEEIIQRRIREEHITNADQARVSVAGKNYENLVAFSLEINRILKNIPNDLIIEPVTKNSKIIGDFATINVGEETQKPDADLAIYKRKKDSPLIICSTKTSLRERAGQSYKWKLLLDISRCNCEHDDGCPLSKYEITYPADREIYFYFITADFYDEIHQPQQRGMFQFFDGSYVTKKIKAVNYIKSLSGIIEDINEIF